MAKAIVADDIVVFMVIIIVDIGGGGEVYLMVLLLVLASIGIVFYDLHAALQLQTQTKEQTNDVLAWAVACCCAAARSCFFISADGVAKKHGTLVMRI